MAKVSFLSDITGWEGNETGMPPGACQDHLPGGRSPFLPCSGESEDHLIPDPASLSFPSKEESGLFLQDFDGEETLEVDWNTKQVAWRLPELKQVGGIDVQGALSNIAVMKNNMEVLMERSNRTQSPNAAPIAKVYLRTPLEMGDPNMLVCFADRFFPPVLNIKWLKNGQPVSQGVEETAFYPSVDATFRKFSYLPLVPEDGDVYVCQVDHWGLDRPLVNIWSKCTGISAPTLLPETMENTLCALGLALAILGIITGPIIFIKARRMRSNTRGRGPL
uniref:Ig-like domain-containing protein n=1 Tax=Salvator merianae TaxID=96440 RepID=A0A8D0BWV8_SALMN